MTQITKLMPKQASLGMRESVQTLFLAKTELSWLSLNFISFRDGKGQNFNYFWSWISRYEATTLTFISKNVSDCLYYTSSTLCQLMASSGYQNCVYFTPPTSEPENSRHTTPLMSMMKYGKRWHIVARRRLRRPRIGSTWTFGADSYRVTADNNQQLIIWLMRWM